jgi:hypothetical protein
VNDDERQLLIKNPRYIEILRRLSAGEEMPGDWHGVLQLDARRAGHVHQYKMELTPDGKRLIGVGESSSTAVRLTVDLAKKVLTIDGTPHDVSSELALRWIRILAEAEGQWFSGKELESIDSHLMAARTDRLKKLLPRAIQKCIATKRGTGSRLKLPPVK